MRGKVTIQAIADSAGVSKFAASRALSGKSGVSASTREKIIQAAGRLGYYASEAHASAAVLPAADDGEGGTIVVLFPHIRYQSKDSAYWGPVFDGISARLNQKGIDLLTLTEPSRERVFSLLKPEAIRGIITIGAISSPMLLEIDRLGIPVVMVDRADPAFPSDTVFTDNMHAMRELTTKLVGRGYRKFRFVGNIAYAESFSERWLAYRAALESCGIAPDQDPRWIGPEADDLETLVARLDPKALPEVFVCANDRTAQFMIEQLGRRRIVVPNDCAVTGFDNTGEGQPIFGTVNVHKELLGMRAVDQLLWRMANRGTAHEKKTIGGDVVLRDRYAYKADKHGALSLT